MRLNNEIFAEDVFKFNAAFGPKDNALSDPIFDALTARDINIDALTDSQLTAFQTADALAEAVLGSSIETADEAVAQLSEKGVNIVATDDLQTIDGVQLNAAATTDGQIVIDDELSGEALRSVLAEEVAEIAYYDAFGAASHGDLVPKLPIVPWGAQTPMR